MKKKELLLEDWKECVENIRFFRNQINKISIWEFGLFPAVGIAVAINFLKNSNYLFGGITLIILSFLLGFIDNLNHINARYSLINIIIAKDIEKQLGTKLVTAIGTGWEKRGKADKESCFKQFEINLFHINNLKRLKYLIFLVGVFFIVYGA